MENKNNSLVNIRFVAKTSDIRNSSENIRSGNTEQNAYHRDLKCMFEDMLPCYCYTTKAIAELSAPDFRNLQAKKRI